MIHCTVLNAGQLGTVRAFRLSLRVNGALALHTQGYVELPHALVLGGPNDLAELVLEAVEWVPKRFVLESLEDEGS